jgi:small neutral amino acid transporter SnatA (MarC family)
MHEGFTACHDVGNAKAGEAVSLVTGRQGAAILVRVMGIILASLAVEIVLTTLGVSSWAPVSR